MRRHLVLALALLQGHASAQDHRAPSELPSLATTQLMKSLEHAEAHAHHPWRDTPPLDADGTVNAFVEIARGDRRKWEFDMRAGVRAVDRVMPAAIGGYPVNYGFVPQTVSYDGDPFDALILGAPIPGGTFVRGVVVGILFMEDEKGPDSKVVLSPRGRDGKTQYELSSDERQRIARYFTLYKRHEPGKFSDVQGWGSAGEGRERVRTTHAFFVHCRQRTGQPCRLPALQEQSPP